MPYINKSRRIVLDAGAPPRTVGDLTYCIQQLLRHYLLEHELSYQRLAECLGALEGAKSDLQERVLWKYELQKRGENGDVWYHDGAGI